MGVNIWHGVGLRQRVDNVYILIHVYYVTLTTTI